MPLLAPIENIKPTNDEKIARQVSLLLSIPKQIKSQLLTSYKQGHTLMWGDQGGVTPAQRIAKLNETRSAAELLSIEEVLFNFLSATLAGQDDAALSEIVALHENIPAYTVTKGVVKLT